MNQITNLFRHKVNPIKIPPKVYIPPKTYLNPAPLPPKGLTPGQAAKLEKIVYRKISEGASMPMSRSHFQNIVHNVPLTPQEREAKNILKEIAKQKAELNEVSRTRSIGKDIAKLKKYLFTPRPQVDRQGRLIRDLPGAGNRPDYLKEFFARRKDLR